MMMDNNTADQKKHRASQAGRKKEKKNKAHGKVSRHNPKAFTMYRGSRASKMAQRTSDLNEKKLQVPLIDRTPMEPPPIVIGVVGPPKTGKTTLIKSLVKKYTKQNLSDTLGPITVVSGKKRRLTFVECTNDLNSMIDVAKISDLILLLIDGSFGFEMETFEFLNILQAHGFPKIMGVLTHLDTFTSAEKLKKTKKVLKHRFWTEIYQGAKLFYLSGLLHGRYLNREVLNLARFISVMKFRPLVWKNTHSYILVDRVEDLSNPEDLRQNPKLDRKIALYGYVRGTALKEGSRAHIPGVGDVILDQISQLPDPCPLPETMASKRRTLNEKEKLLYAPMSDVSGILYDKDAVYIDVLKNSKNGMESDEKTFGESLLESLQNVEGTIDQHLKESTVQLFRNKPVVGIGDEQRRTRRKVSFAEELNEEDIVTDDDESVDLEGSDVIEEGTDTEYSLENGGTRVSSDSESEFNDEDHIFTKLDDEQDLHLHGDDNYEVVSSKWKENLSSKALKAHENLNAVSVMKLVYGPGEDSKVEDYDRGEIDGFLKRVKGSKLKQSQYKDDNTLYHLGDMVASPLGEEIFDLVKGRFVDYNVNGEGNQSDEDRTGFEDLEGVSEGSDESSDEDRKEQLTQEELLAKKKEDLKRKFDAEYDEGNETKTLNVFEETKKEQEQRQKLNREEFLNDAPELRIRVEGILPGHYARVIIQKMPCEFIEYFNPRFPVILGGLSALEAEFGFIHARVKKHRWHEKILKTNEPLIYSLGWRRFQSLPLFYTSDSNGIRYRLLKYTPRHMHCMSVFYGPITPQNTGFCAFKSITENTNHFRISATGIILEADRSVQIVKKLKLTGTPLKVNKNTAFIKDMFNSPLEVTKFEGAALKSVSGIRGQVKKAIKSPPGVFRATFEDRILMSDIVFLRAWYPITPRTYYNPITSLLLENKQSWKGMRLNAELRRENDIAIPSKPDSEYKPIERPVRKFNPLKVPKKIEKELPYATKPKQLNRRNKKSYLAQRETVILEPKEKREVTLLQQLATIKNEKVERQKKKAMLNRAKFAKKTKSSMIKKGQ